MREKIKKLTPKFLIRIYQRARYLAVTALFLRAGYSRSKKIWLFFAVCGGTGTMQDMLPRN